MGGQKQSNAGRPKLPLPTLLFCYGALTSLVASKKSPFGGVFLKDSAYQLKIFLPQCVIMQEM